MTDEQATVSSDEVKKNTVSPTQRSRGSLFGSILFGMMILFVLGVLVAGIWGGYRGYQMSQERTTLPSIAMLAVDETGSEAADEPQDTIPQEATTTPDVRNEEGTKKARTTTIKVFNGGAAKGSASVLAEALKKAGYTQVTIGNTIKDYSGVVVYFAPEVETEAMIVKNDLLKTYPKAETRPAVVTNTETTQAPISVIVGK